MATQPSPLDTAKAIYLCAVDPRASDSEGAAWWDEVADEVRDVIAARSLNEAADLSVSISRASTRSAKSSKSM
jgi:hypothetical protein